MQKAELLRQLYADSPEPAFGFDRDLRILWVNPACSLRFPALCADASLLKQFPDFQLEHVTKIVSGPAPKSFRSRTDKTAALLVACFSSEDDPLFTGVYQDACLPDDDLPDPQGAALLSYCIRTKVFGICNQLDDLACRAEENGNDKALDSIARVEEQCLGLVRLSSNFNLYYRQDTSLLESIPMEEMLSNLCRRMELQLIPLNLRFDYAVSCGSAVCRRIPLFGSLHRRKLRTAAGRKRSAPALQTDRLPDLGACGTGSRRYLLSGRPVSGNPDPLSDPCFG